MDGRLRDLQRAAADGDPDARLRLLAERVRSGLIGGRHLRVAAWLGDPVAARLRASDALAGEDEPDVLPPGEIEQRPFERAFDPDPVAAGLLETLGGEPLAAAALAVAEATLPEWTARYGADERPAAAIAAARRQAGTTPSRGAWDLAGLDAIGAADGLLLQRRDGVHRARAMALVAAAAAVLRAQPTEGARLLVEALDVDQDGPVAGALRVALVAVACGDLGGAAPR